MTQRTKPRRLLPVITHYAIALLITFVIIGGAMAAVDRNDTKTLTLYTDEDLNDAQELIFGSGVGKLFALLSVAAWVVPVCVVVLLCILAAVARLSNNTEAYSGILKAVFAVVGIILLMVLALGLIGRLTPDISTIAIGG